MNTKITLNIQIFKHMPVNKELLKLDCYKTAFIKTSAGE